MGKMDTSYIDILGSTRQKLMVSDKASLKFSQLQRVARKLKCLDIIPFKDADQTARVRRLVCAFVVHKLRR